MPFRIKHPGHYNIPVDRPKVDEKQYIHKGDSTLDINLKANAMINERLNTSIIRESKGKTMSTLQDLVSLDNLNSLYDLPKTPAKDLIKTLLFSSEKVLTTDLNPYVRFPFDGEIYEMNKITISVNTKAKTTYKVINMGKETISECVVDTTGIQNIVILPEDNFPKESTILEIRACTENQEDDSVIYAVEIEMK